MFTYWGDKKIDPTCDKSHVSLTCKNHPDLLWYTKNIGYIGARSIFFDVAIGDHTRIMQECDCPTSDLVIAPRG